MPRGRLARRTGYHALGGSFGPYGIADIPLSPVLADIQRQMIADPGAPVRWGAARRG